MAQLVADGLRRQHLFEQLGQNAARADQHQVVERPGIGDDEPHGASEAEAFQVAALALQIFDAVGLVNLVRL